MKPLGAIYKDVFFRKRHTLHWRAPIFCQAVIDVLNPKSVIDVGCATGDLVRQFRQMGVPCEGLEGSPHALKHSVIKNTFVHDLRTPLPYPMRFNEVKYEWFDLVICLEVFEHIELEYVKVFLNNLDYLGLGEILASIAGPGQGGHYHVNLQPMEYWDKLLLDLGYIRKQEIADRVKESIYDWRSRPGIRAFYHNLVYYEKSFLKTTPCCP